MKVTLLYGTWGKKDEWCKPNGALTSAIIQAGHEIIPPPTEWGGALDGVIGKNSDWDRAAQGMYDAYKNVDDLCIVAHSHAGNVAAIACWYGLSPKKVITVCTPIRGDLRRQYIEMQSRSDYWVHIHSDWTDYWQVLGSLFDGRIGIYRKMQYADKNVGIPNIGHSGALTKEIILNYIDY